MKIDSKLARILSNFCLDIAKAAFIASFASGALITTSFFETIFLLTKTLFNVSLFLTISWQFAKMEDNNYE